MPYQSDPVSRAKINAGLLDYMDVHLSHVAQMVWEGFFGPLNVALIEVAGITADGTLIPSSSVGNNKTWIDRADRVILEVNSWQPSGLDGMHDIYYGTALPPHRKPLQILAPADRIGVPHLLCPPEKIVAVVHTDAPDRNTPFKTGDRDSELIAGHVLDFLAHEVRRGRLPATLLPLQSGVGNIANAVLTGLDRGPFRPMTAYTEVIQDGMLQLLRSGTLSFVSATALSLSDDGVAELRATSTDYRDRIILRPQEISNHPEVIRRLGCLAMNGMIEADIYGNVNSTHIMGSSIQNGIGGSGDFARNAYIAMFLTRRPPRTGRSPASCRWSAMWTTPSTTSMSSSPNKAWPTCAACHRAVAPGRSSSIACTPTTGRPCRTTSTGRRPARVASTPRTCSRKRSPGTCGTCAKAPCDSPEPGGALAGPPGYRYRPGRLRPRLIRAPSTTRSVEHHHHTNDQQVEQALHDYAD